MNPALLLMMLGVSHVASFSIIVSPGRIASKSRVLMSDNENEKDDEGLIVDNLDGQLQNLSTKYPTSANSYLEASRKRAELAKQGKLESHNSGASDEDWKQVAETISKEDNDWEASLKEAGNSDSQILMFTDEGDDGDEDEEPKLLLF